MNSYRLVLFGGPQNAERTGYVYCATDEQARAAARALLQFHHDHQAVHAYDGERLVCEILRRDSKVAAAR